jgi:hypothetical protein
MDAHATPAATSRRDRLPFPTLPPIFTVLAKLGLELKTQETGVNFYTVDRLERPEGH